MKKCPFCAEEIQDAAIVCRFCGADLVTHTRHNPPSASVVMQTPGPSNGVAAVLSLIIPGAGQMYKGRVGSGLVWLVVVVVGYAALIIPGLVLHLMCVIMAASGSSPSIRVPEPAKPEWEMPSAGQAAIDATARRLGRGYSRAAAQTNYKPLLAAIVAFVIVTAAIYLIRGG